MSANFDQKFQELLSKIAKVKSGAKLDLSRDEDLSLAVMNLISLEEHFFFTAEKTGKDTYFDLIRQVRDIRKDLLARLMPHHEGETWCISKHLLAACMRLIEVATKLQQEGDAKQAKRTFDHAYQVYSLFWALKFKLLDVPQVKQLETKKDWTVQDLVTRLVDCCKE